MGCYLHLSLAKKRINYICKCSPLTSKMVEGDHDFLEVARSFRFVASINTLFRQMSGKRSNIYFVHRFLGNV